MKNIENRRKETRIELGWWDGVYYHVFLSLIVDNAICETKIIKEPKNNIEEKEIIAKSKKN